MRANETRNLSIESHRSSQPKANKGRKTRTYIYKYMQYLCNHQQYVDALVYRWLETQIRVDVYEV